MATTGAPDESNAFSECYASEWWEGGTPAVGDKLFPWLPVGEAMNSKAAFCFCAVSMEGSKLWERITHYSSWIKWTSLGLCIFFFLAFLAELFLVCCRKKTLESYYTDTKE